MLKIGEYIKYVRNKKKLTMKNLANLTSSSISHISKIENNLYKPSDEFLRKISEALNVDYSELLKIKYSIDITAYDDSVSNWLLYKDIAIAFSYFLNLNNIFLDNVELSDIEKYIISSNIDQTLTLIRNLRKKEG